MKIVRTIQALRRNVAAWRSRGKHVGLVPTMGYFHAGHLSLMQKARQENDVVVVSLFVNPIQFGPREDLAKYPRDLRRDAAMARSVGVDVLFVPTVEEMYPGWAAGEGAGSLTVVDVPGVSDGLCGALRPGHFRGVATVVAKLLNCVQPDTMYLGQKDAQQVAVLKKMVVDMNFPVKICVGATVREPDGLAMSSRNVFLSPTERKEALALSRALRLARAKILRGELDANKIISQIKKLILEETSASIEYVSCVSTADMRPVRRIKGEILIALAVKFPSARLIDNMVIKLR